MPNCFIIFPEEIIDESKAILRGSRALDLKHINNLGRVFHVGVLGGNVGTARVLSSNPTQNGELVLELNLCSEEAVFMPLSCELILGVSRPRMMRRIFMAIASIGIRRLWLVPSELGEKSYLSSSSLSKKAIYRSLIGGLEQGARTYLPEVNFVSLDEVLTMSIDYSHRLFYSKESSHKIYSLQSKYEDANLLIAVGNEVGWSIRERDGFYSKGFQGISLGNGILRTETATLMALGQAVIYLNELKKRHG